MFSSSVQMEFIKTARKTLVPQKHAIARDLGKNCLTRTFHFPFSEFFARRPIKSGYLFLTNDGFVIMAFKSRSVWIYPNDARENEWQKESEST